MSPKSPEQFEAVRLNTRDRIERAALRVFARSGYAGSSVRDVAREAGMAQGLLYNYFRSKHDLLDAILRRAIAEVARSFDAAGDEGPPHEQLERLIRTSFRLVREQLEFWQLLYGIRQQPDVVGAVQAELAAFTDHVQRTLQGHLSAIGHPEPALRARLLFAAIDGVAQHYALAPHDYPLDGVIPQLITMFSTPAMSAPSLASRPSSAPRTRRLP